MINTIEFEDSNWEERIVYYYASVEIKSNEIIKHVCDTENIKLNFNVANQVFFNESTADISDLFLAKKSLVGEIRCVFVLENDWNYKVFLIKTDDHVILKIWETYA
ncbi:MAG: hypothetical protein EOP48_08610 [Sphingobacteriales bacterium]|nr:MAG: hypothetical protein EOP48_08610 [Sphingobacteriales bacterium]